jgi:hypothetical protein
MSVVLLIICTACEKSEQRSVTIRGTNAAVQTTMPKETATPGGATSAVEGAQAPPAPAAPSETVVLLTELPIASSNNMKYVVKNASLLGKISILGTEYEQGITTVPIGSGVVAQVTYDLDGQFTKFSGVVGMSNIGNLRVRVLGDGVELFASDVLDYYKAPAKIDLDVTGVHELTLECNSVDVPPKYEVSWGNAQLTK